jgi:transcriptional regulator with XRE-family HTH domain
MSDMSQIAARFKRVRQTEEEETSKPHDFDTSYQLRAKMLGVLLRDARLGAVRSVEDCARLLRVLPQQVEAWEYGDSVPSLPQLELLANFLDVPISHFWGTETLSEDRGTKVDAQVQYMALRDRMVGALLRKAREDQQIDLAEVADRSGLSEGLLNAYELGEQSIPMHELSVLSSIVKKNMNYFLESSSQIGELLSLKEMWKHFSNLPEEVREFAANPVNIGFIEVALMLSKMPVDKLRTVGASILDITR